MLPLLAGLILAATKVKVRKCVWLLVVALKKCRLAFLVNLLKELLVTVNDSKIAAEMRQQRKSPPPSPTLPTLNPFMIQYVAARVSCSPRCFIF